MIEVSKMNEVPAVTLPTFCQVWLNGEIVTVRVVNARRSGQIWLMDHRPAYVDGNTVDGVTYARRNPGVPIRPLARFDYMDTVTMLTPEGVI